jgi:hypothetical protein
LILLRKINHQVRVQYKILLPQAAKRLFTALRAE